jgi:DNA repair exonuclease SbcCD ATPase subunit
VPRAPSLCSLTVCPVSASVSAGRQDLTRYHKALDRALMRYHQLKVDEINRYIRELWSRMYKGNDIEEIMLVSGEESGGKAQRSYNYRVVMKKGSTLLDMRGRCSAGQRSGESEGFRLRPSSRLHS